MQNNRNDINIEIERAWQLNKTVLPVVVDGLGLLK